MPASVADGGADRVAGMAARDLVIGGNHAVQVALELRGSDCLELFLRDAPADGAAAPAQAAMTALAQDHAIPVHRVEDRTLDKLYGDSHHQGIVLRRRPPPFVPLGQLLSACRNDDRVPFMLVLDCVQDPRNFGACLRVADGAGADGVIFARDKSARIGNVVAKAASGALDTVPLVCVSNLAAALQQLAAAGIWITGAADDAPESLYEVDFTLPSALVLGNEGDGLRRLTRERCDRLSAIPMAGRLGSLNVATAAAVCLFEARRQRLAGGCGESLPR